jgi:hypothetical protein
LWYCDLRERRTRKPLWILIRNLAEEGMGGMPVTRRGWGRKIKIAELKHTCNKCFPNNSANLMLSGSFHARSHWLDDFFETAASNVAVPSPFCDFQVGSFFIYIEIAKEDALLTSITSFILTDNCLPFQSLCRLCVYS